MYSFLFLRISGAEYFIPDRLIPVRGLSIYSRNVAKSSVSYNWNYKLQVLS